MESPCYSEFSTFKQFRQVIIWGLLPRCNNPWVKTFTHIGCPTYWFGDDDHLIDFDYSRSFFITEGGADEKIPLNRTSVYCVHGDSSKYAECGARLFELLYNTTAPDDAFAISQDTMYKVWQHLPYETIYMYGASDLLPHEIHIEDANHERVRTVFYSESISSADHPFHIFQKTCEDAGIPVVQIVSVEYFEGNQLWTIWYNEFTQY